MQVERDGMGLTELEFSLTMLLELRRISPAELKPFIKQFRKLDVRGWLWIPRPLVGALSRWLLALPVLGPLLTQIPTDRDAPPQVDNSGRLGLADLKVIQETDAETLKAMRQSNKPLPAVFGLSTHGASSRSLVASVSSAANVVGNAANTVSSAANVVGNAASTSVEAVGAAAATGAHAISAVAATGAHAAATSAQAVSAATALGVVPVSGATPEESTSA
jgi:hypothetical protein